MERLRTRGRIGRPTAREIHELAESLYLDLSDQEVSEMEEVIDRSLALVDRLDDLPQPRWPIKYEERDPGYRPSAQEDPLNLFITKCYVKGARQGKLSGKRVGLKDNLCVAGVPMTGASRVAEGFVPDVDAVVVERLLDAGTVIVGKLNMDDFAFFSTGETSAFGFTRNPVNPEYSPGGSSSASGAAVASGDVDIALGVDEGGSGRIPAAWCGVYSIKPTHGLVPTYGLIYMDHTLDFICPIASTVDEMALTLEVIAGDDPRDPQWVRGPIKVDSYSRAKGQGISGLKIGLLKEAFEQRVAEPDVNQTVRDAVKKLGDMGASVQEVSLPMFGDARPIWVTLTNHSVSGMVETHLEGYCRGGYCNLNWQEAFGRARRVRSSEFPPLFKMSLIVGKYLQREYYSTYFAKAQNLRNVLRDQVNGLLKEVDALALPTTPMKPVKLSEKKLSLMEMGGRGAPTPRNTLPFNVTGHPAITLPCHPKGSLPIGLQLAGRHWDESTLFRFAYAWEQGR